MIQIKATIKGDKAVERAFERAGRKVVKLVSRKLDWVGDKIVADIKRDPTLFKHKEARGGKYLSGRKIGLLQQSIYAGKNKAKRGAIVKPLGWQVPYGPIVEWGPKGKKVWRIAPKGFRLASKRSGGQRAIQYLRFRSKGKIVYAKEAWVRWRKSSTRPHFGPTTERWEPRLMRLLEKVPAKALE